MLWDYAFTFDFQGDTEFAITYNESTTVAYAIMAVDAGGTGELHVTASSGELPLVTLAGTTAVPADHGYRYRQLDGTFLSYEELTFEASRRTIVVPRLSIREVQSAKASVQERAFDQPLLPLLEFAQPFTLAAHPAPLREHLTSFLKTILGPATFATQPLSLECHYGYTVSGMAVEVPVVLVARQDVAISTDEQLIDQIAASIEQWRETLQPPTTDARLLLQVTLWNALLDQRAKLLHLANVSLPTTSISG